MNCASVSCRRSEGASAHAPHPDRSSWPADPSANVTTCMRGMLGGGPAGPGRQPRCCMDTANPVAAEAAAECLQASRANWGARRRTPAAQTRGPRLRSGLQARGMLDGAWDCIGMQRGAAGPHPQRCPAGLDRCLPAAGRGAPFPPLMASSAADMCQYRARRPWAAGGHATAAHHPPARAAARPRLLAAARRMKEHRPARPPPLPRCLLLFHWRCHTLPCACRLVANLLRFRGGGRKTRLA